MNKIIKLGLCILFLLVSFVNAETVDIASFNHTGQDYLWNDNMGKNESNITTTVTDGLIAYWDLNGDAVDSVGSNDGTISGVVTNSTGHFGGSNTAYEFGGAIADVVNFGNDVSLNFGTSDFSMSFWVKTSQDYYGTIINKYTANLGFIFYISPNGDLRYVFGDGTPQVVYDGSTIFNDGEWYHVVVNNDRDGLAQFYFNGQEAESIDISAKSGNVSNAFDFVLGGWEGFNGSLDNFRVYNRLLTFEEVKALYQERNDNHTDGSTSYAFCITDCINETELIAQWKLNGDAIDSVGGYNGTVIGALNTTGRYKGAYDFDGTADIALPNISSISGNNPRTISLWAKVDDGYSHDALFSYGTWAGHSMFIIVHGMDNPNDIYVWGYSADLATTGAVFNDNEWFHLVVTYDGTSFSTTSAKIYINGIEQSTSLAGSGGILNTTNNDFSIGDSYLSSNMNFYGNIDNVMIWNRSISEQEVHKLYLSGYEEHIDNSVLSNITYDGDVDLSCQFFNSPDAPFNDTYSTDTFNYSSWTGYYSNLASLSLTSYSSGEKLISKRDYGVCELSGYYFTYANFSYSIGVLQNITSPSVTDNNGNSFNITNDQGNDLEGAYEDTDITIKDSTGKKLVEVEGLFSDGEVDLSDIQIEYNDVTVVVDFSSVSTNIGSTHTLYYPNTGTGFLLCPEAKTIAQATSGCANATLFTHHDATNNISKSIGGSYDVTATIDGNYYKISGLTGTAITWAQNKSTISRVSITNSPPTVDTVTLSDSDGGDMDLYPNSTVTINCSGTASDTDGWSTITLNATINTSVAAGSSDNLLNHYSNTSCTTSQNTATQANYECTFSVWYNTIPGTWTCTVTADDTSTTASNIDTETMGQLMAIDINEGDLDFGALAVGASTTDSALDSSNNKTIYNQGNVIFDVNLQAYGDSGIGDNNSMSCDSGNVTISMLRYTFNTTEASHNWTLMTPMINGSGTDYNISVPVSPDTSGTPVNPSNNTWWSFKVPSAPIVSGDCSGTLIFSAISDT